MFELEIGLWIQISRYADLERRLIHKNEMWGLKGKTEGFSWVCVGMVELGLCF